ncbi:inositol monophosphatase family protein [Mastigocoleus sp. MO_188.B34]|uniref:3'(2'),5'-bisphosphate nucleotidase CysQ family protein n=1 Tax=Mastigocoleus sp. MO_188.B34 TaxID=3036635 RepID=UPI002627348B|nr:inositol monophosphatase family protein [Mastigocoleus sp. MO_188.B34]MDJ0697710.1 inositol monophosphatase family protein [Mastigocoleus sp. MO_188.B34]
MKTLEEILTITRGIAWGATDILRSYYRGDNKQDLEVNYKQNEPVTVADTATNKYIVEKLQAALGSQDFGYISEETYQKQATNGKELVWIIDPLDGTRDFINKTGEYAIHIALVKDKRPILAVVAQPETEKLFYAIKGQGSFLELRSSTGDNCTKSLNVSVQDSLEDLTLVVSRSHRNEKLNYLLNNLPCKNQKAVGSIGGKIAAIVEQNADIYISLSGKSAPKDWDLAAPELILSEAGGTFTHFDGTSLSYNTGDINQWGGLIASNGKCHQILCEQAEKILEQFE